jgi:hypothetical protein
VRACGDVTLRVKPGTEPGAPFGVAIGEVTSHDGPTAFRDVQLWFQFTAGAVGTAPQTLGPVNTTIKCDQNGQEFEFELRANTAHRPTVAVQLALDQSGSMSDPAGTSGSTRLQVLKDAASLFATLIQKNNGIGIIRFDQVAYPPNDPTYGGMAITKVMSDGFGDATRLAAQGVIAAHGAHGSTSIGNGLEMAHNQLAALPAGSYDQTAILLLTDGLENTPKWIADVAGLIDNRTFAIGLGNEAQVNTAALTALGGSTGGYLLLSGLLSASLDDQFRLRKFFLQILAGVTNTSIVKDPVGYVGMGSRVRIPFVLNEADINARVILLTELPIVRLAIETPDGKLIDAANAAAFGVRFDMAQQVRTASCGLPIAFQSQTQQAGTWHAVLDLDRDAIKKWEAGDHPGTSNQGLLQALRSQGAKYCLSVHTYSNLRMVTSLSQSGFVPGSTLYLRAVLSEYGLPVTHRAQVHTELVYPDGSHGDVDLAETEPGVFTAALTAQQSGIYRMRVMAEGGTLRGQPFTREELKVGAVWAGGDQPPPRPSDGGGNGHGGCCELLECLLSERVLSRELTDRLRHLGVHLDALRQCAKSHCGSTNAANGASKF